MNALSDESTQRETDGPSGGEPSTPARWPRRLFAFALVFQLFVLLYGAAQEVRWGHYGFHTGEYGSAAIHTRKHGAFILSTVPDWIVPTRAQLNFHHPYLLHQYIAGSQLLFGEKPWVMRLPNMVFSYAALVGLWALVRRARGERTAALAVLFFVLNPLHGSFGFLPEYQICAITWALWAGVGWLETIRKPRATSIALFLVCTALAGMTDWPWYPIAFLVFLSAAWQLKPGGPLAVKYEATPRRVRALRITVAAFAAVVLATFVQHLLVARFLGEFGQATGSFGHRTAMMHASILVPLLVQRFGLLHATVLPLLSIYWFFDTARSKRRDPITLYLGSIYLGAVIDTAVFRWGFAYHEYRTYWYVAPFAFIAAELVERFAAYLRERALQKRVPAWLETRALASVAGALALVMFGFFVPVVALSRLRSGSLTMSDYDDHLDDLLTGRAARALVGRDRMVYIGSSLDPRLEMFWVVDGPSTVIDSAPMVRALIRQTPPVVAIDRRQPMLEDAVWRTYLQQGQLLVIDDAALLLLRPGATPSVEVAHVRRRTRRSPLDAWLNASFEGPAELVPAPRTEVEQVARAIHARPEAMNGIQSGLTPLLDTLPRDLVGASRR